MTAPEPVAKRYAVSVIVPARNEEVCLGACVQSVTAQTGLSYEVIVVDDGSTDGTRQIALSFPGVRVVDAGPLPEGWSGKNNAMAAGARQARGEWLLFTDADTVHAPGSLARSLAEARRQKADLLSYSPRQEVVGVWEKAVMPVVFAELAITYRPSVVSDPKSSAAAANGQYMLISREAYEAVGGFAAIAGSLLEDVDLARAVKSSGRRIFFRNGGDAVSARMYRSFAQLQEGWTKNLALLFPSPVRLAVLRLLEFLLILASLEITVLGVLYRRTNAAVFAAVLFLVLIGLFVARIRQAHFESGATTLSLLGLPVFAYLLVRSKLFWRRGKVSWKGRVYPSCGAARKERASVRHVAVF
jgi:cellulose synthase/poly-beta-1,6-N-acetylglucosamine synthase-like glycosyltransferase